ncbi:MULTISPECIES: hypothetical protein [unclassified Kaistella]|uniref:hypothetical protein n=1 Tax=unclassified Kaistella TaxID=2762626 RepID=UPI002735B817|nr:MULTISPECIES: hypothetical protein [unclassified Kaistella]MDP2452643.1 hypothetical protein [Kaistella sp. SH11-4b]MDP2455552.1 hypothetical protein [Kaistella sp. SH40-3]MDP2458456.1 hypothetical protein [Kaistella sp. SH19-2b]
MKSRKQILSEVMHSSIPKFNISLLTDEQLDDLEAILKRKGLNFISIEKAEKQGFKIPNDPNEIIDNLIKFYKK